MPSSDGAVPGVNLQRLLAAGRFTEVELICRRRLAQQPGDPAALNNLGNVLEELGRLPEAETAYRQAIESRPDFAEAHYNLGTMLHGQRRLAEAAAAYQRAIGLRPNLAQAHNNLGAALRDLRRLGEAMTAFEAAARSRPDYAEAQFNQSMCRLMLGDYANGWAQYEWRWRTHQARDALRQFSAPLWLGRQSLAGRTILLHAEQGFGDTLQFCRFAPAVAALGAKVVLEVQPELERLLTQLQGVSAVVRRGQALPRFDCHTPLMSLPLALGLALEDVAPTIPYLQAPRDAAARWARRLGRSKHPRIGIVWAGAARPDQPVAAAVDRRRSLPFDALEPLFRIEGVTKFSLQKGRPGAQPFTAVGWRTPGGTIVDHTSELEDFADTAALMANLDLVISCDTAVAHLAGAMGKPVWILSRFDGCWRWLADRDDSPWYPTARLFRQTTPGDWTGVVARAASALTTLKQRHSARQPAADHRNQA